MKDYRRTAPGSIVATGEVETVHEEILFGGE